MDNKKKTEKQLSKDIVRSAELARLKNLVADLSKSRDDLAAKNQKQAYELKAIHRQLRSGAEKKIRSEEQIHTRAKAMESVADGIFIIDAKKPDFPVIYVNQSFQKMVGCAKNEILGRNYFLLSGAYADSHVIEKISQSIRRDKSFHGEIINFKKNGKRCCYLLRIAPVHDPIGSISHYVGIQTDVTLGRERELKIDEQRDEILHVTRVGKLAEFVSSLAHEISQPLTAILSYAQAAQRLLSNREPELQKILSYIISDDQRASEVIQRMRSLLKKSKPETKPLDINAIINETVTLITIDANIRNVVIKLDLESDLPIILGDRIQLQQVLLNLISNSFDALDGVQGVREILIHTSRKDTGKIIVEMKDSGCGIPAQNMPKLFSRFFTSKPDGLGMGLSISRSIIEAHGGLLEAKDNPGRGAAFYFTIPAGAKGAQ